MSMQSVQQWPIADDKTETTRTAVKYNNTYSEVRQTNKLCCNGVRF